MNGSVQSSVTEFGRECGWRECATTYVLGNLSNEESTAYAAHLDACGACLEEFELAREAVARVDRSVCAAALEQLQAEQEQVVGGATELRARLLAGIATTPQDAAPAINRTWQSWCADEGANTAGKQGLFSVAASADGWQAIGVPGIDVKRLSVDPKRRYVTMLVRMAPGTSYPSHRHAGSEECFVLAGEIKVGEQVLRAGDYQIATQNSVHGVQSTENGCTLLIVSSQDDELIG
jgi:quercetin dioxygenase-like cupin family protein